METNIIPVEKEEKAITKITNYMESAVVQARFAKIMGERGASNYIASVLIAVADSVSLQKCSPVSIYTSALRAATLRLSVDPGTGQAYLVPFKGRATLIVGYKGLHDLAVRTNRYRYINVSHIYEGQEVTEDQISGFHKLGGARIGDKIIGWIAAFEMLPRFGGYAKTMYMTVEEIHEHGKRYSKSYNDTESPWQKEAAKMERKTVLRLLLRRWGYIDPADVQTLDDLDNDEPIDAGFVSIPDSTIAPPIHNSQEANISILTGEGNPDPVKDDTWSAWESWEERAKKVNVLVSDVNRAGATESDLQAYIREVSVYILDAERQAAAGA